MMIEKLNEDGSFQHIKTDIITMDNHFEYNINLENNEGIYKISILIPMMTPHRLTNIPVTSFYLDYSK